jgi:hypothetical protein
MSRVWRVERNTGSRAFLIFMAVRKEVWRPQTISREDFFNVLAPGTSVEESMVQRVLGLSQKAMN